MMKMKPRSTKLDLHVNKRFLNITILVLLFTIIFISSILIRVYLFENSSLPGKEAHFSINTAKDLSKFKQNFVIDELAVQELLWPLLIALVSFITKISLEFSAILLSFIFGIFSIILVYFVIEKIGFKKRNMAIAFFLISPATIWLFSSYSKFILPFFFSLLALYLFLTGKHLFSLFAVAITSLFGIVSSISVLTFSLLGFKKEFWNWLWKAFLVTLFINFILFFIFPFVGIFNLSFENLFSLFFSLSKFGVSMFAFLLAFMGIFITWKERKERKELFLIYIVFILLFIFYITNKEFIFFFNFILIFLAAIGFTKLLEREWASSLIKNLTLIILIAGLIFPLIFMPLRIASLQPDDVLVDSLEFLRDKEDGKVLSVKENGYWIKSFSGKEAFVDEFKAKVNPEIDNKASEFLSGRNLERLSEGFKNESIRYVFLDPKTKQLFRTEDEGILLLLKHTDVFKRIYNQHGIEIWEFESENV